MGFGGAQLNALTNFQTATNSLGANMQRDAANREADMQREQAAILLNEGEQAAQQKSREVGLTADSQAAQYLDSGVLMMGSPLAVVSETVRLGGQEVQAIRKASEARARLGRLQADETQKSGLANVLQAEGQNEVTRQQNQIQQKAAKSTFFRNMAVSAGTGLFNGLIRKR